MRRQTSTVLLASLTVAFLAVGLFTRELVLVVLAAGTAALLAFSLVGARGPAPAALRSFVGHIVRVEAWGSPVSLSTPEVVLTSVNVLGAGLHLFFRLPGGAAAHLKVAQPSGLLVKPDRIAIESARYVQWQRKRITRVVGPAALIVESKGPVPVVPGSAA